MLQEGVIISGKSLLSANTHFTRNIFFKDSKSYLSKNRQVGGSVIFMNQAVVLAELCIKSPMQLVFNRPMTSDKPSMLLRVTFKTADIEARFRRHLVLNTGDGFLHYEAFQVNPSFFFFKPGDIISHRCTPYCYASMSPFLCLINTEILFLYRIFNGPIKICLNIFM